MALAGAVIGDNQSSNSEEDVFVPSFEQLVLPTQALFDQVRYSERLRQRGKLGSLQGLGKEHVKSTEFFRNHDAILSQLGKGRKAIQSFINKNRKDKEKGRVDQQKAELNPVYSEVDGARGISQDVKFETPIGEYWTENPWGNSDKWERISPCILE